MFACDFMCCHLRPETVDVLRKADPPPENHTTRKKLTGNRMVNSDSSNE
jgi:hypothetical protein